MSRRGRTRASRGVEGILVDEGVERGGEAGKSSSCPVGSNTTVGPDMSSTLPRMNDSKAVSSGSTSRGVQPAASAATAKSSYPASRTGADARSVISSGIARAWWANARRYDRAHSPSASSQGSSRKRARVDGGRDERPHVLDHRGAVRDVVVERRRIDAEARGDTADAGALGAVPIDEREGRGRDELAAQQRLRRSGDDGLQGSGRGAPTYSSRS